MSEADNPRQTAIRTINAALAGAGYDALQAPHSILTADLEALAATLRAQAARLDERDAG